MHQPIVVSTHILKANTYTIRYPVLEDAPLLQQYINTLSQEKTYITFQGEQQTLEQERDYISGMLSKISHHQGLQLVVECNGMIVGNSDLVLKLRSENHVAVMGISIARDHRNIGLGSLLMQAVIHQSCNRLPTLKLITLTVNVNNHRAIHLYQKFGFIEYGRLPKATCYQDNFVDVIYMYKPVGSLR